jgi:catechol 2,3-dioxygenase-like lactoylglutathione lyase family enzyme
MKFTRLVPMLWVGDIEQTIAFYRDRSGFCVHQPDGRLGLHGEPQSRADDFLAQPAPTPSINRSLPVRFTFIWMTLTAYGSG